MQQRTSSLVAVEGVPTAEFGIVPGASASGRNLLLEMLPSADLSLLSAHLKDVNLERGKALQERGEPIEFIYFPYGGVISFLAVMPDGEAIETVTVGSEGAIGLGAGLGAQTAYCRAVVQLAGSAARIPVTRFAAACDQSKALRRLVVRYGEMLAAEVHQAVACHALHDVEARMCRWLLQARDRVGADTLPLTQEFLAQVLGVRRTTITLVARILQAKGMISYRRGIIRIRDGTALAGAACCCYDVVRGYEKQLTQSPEMDHVS